MSENKPAKPITFNIRGTQTGRTQSTAKPEPPPVAGGRAANSYIEQLRKAQCPKEQT